MKISSELEEKNRTTEMKRIDNRKKGTATTAPESCMNFTFSHLGQLDEFKRA